MDNFIPVAVNVRGVTRIWHMDISTLSLNELIQLKKELEGTKADSINAIDAIIHKNIGYNIDDMKMSKREIKKENRTFKRQSAYVRRCRRKGR